MTKKTIFLTGASGTMGWASFQEMYKDKNLDFVVLLKDSKKDKKLFEPFFEDSRVKIIWGDLVNYEDVLNCTNGVDCVLHIGGMVSPTADYWPKKTIKVNVSAAKNIVKAVKAQPNPDNIRVLYIGTVAETGDRNPPIHWARTGDPIKISVYDHYAISKRIAESVFAESGLKHWVSMRQSSILYPEIISIKNIDPIMFHICLKGCFEWTTIEDSATLMHHFCTYNLPEDFWRSFYNIGSGKEYRLTNWEFENMLFKATGMGKNTPKKIFEPNWFATQNFHGQWYADSDKLEHYLHFRHNTPIKKYLENMSKKVSLYMKLIFLGANKVGKFFIKRVALDKRFGTLTWIKNNDSERISSYFGSKQAWAKIPTNWEQIDVSRATEKVTLLDHGYDESKKISELTVEDMKKVAQFRGGKFLSDSFEFYTPTKWKCAFGHEFEMSPNLVLKGGHWCPKCEPIPWNYDAIAKVNPFFNQVWAPLHNKDEDNYYDENIYRNYDEYEK